MRGVDGGMYVDSHPIQAKGEPANCCAVRDIRNVVEPLIYRVCGVSAEVSVPCLTSLFDCRTFDSKPAHLFGELIEQNADHGK